MQAGRAEKVPGPTASDTPAAVDDVDLPRRIGCGRQVQRKICDFPRPADATDRLPRDERRARFLIIALVAQPVLQRRGLYRAGTDRITTNPAADEIGRHGFRRSEEHTSELQSPCNLV